MECGEQTETLVARLRFSWSRRSFTPFVSLPVLEVTFCTPSLGTEMELQSAGLQSAVSNPSPRPLIIRHLSSCDAA